MNRSCAPEDITINMASTPPCSSSFKRLPPVTALLRSAVPYRFRARPAIVCGSSKLSSATRRSSYYRSNFRWLPTFCGRLQHQVSPRDVSAAVEMRRLTPGRSPRGRRIPNIVASFVVRVRGIGLAFQSSVRAPLERLPALQSGRPIRSQALPAALPRLNIAVGSSERACNAFEDNPRRISMLPGTLRELGRLYAHPTRGPENGRARRLGGVRDARCPPLSSSETCVSHLARIYRSRHPTRQPPRFAPLLCRLDLVPREKRCARSVPRNRYTAPGSTNRGLVQLPRPIRSSDCRLSSGFFCLCAAENESVVSPLE